MQFLKSSSFYFSRKVAILAAERDPAVELRLRQELIDFQIEKMRKLGLLYQHIHDITNHLEFACQMSQEMYPL